MAAQAVPNYPMVSRNPDPQAAVMLSVGSVEAGRDNNVIPSDAVLKLKLRWFRPEVREHMLKRIDEISLGMVIAAGVSPERMPRRQMKGNSGPAGRPFPYSNHNPDFFVDLGAIPIGAKVDTVAVLSLLARAMNGAPFPAKPMLRMAQR